MSEFNIAGQRYEVLPDEDFFWDEPSKSMDYKLSSVLSAGMEFTYEYDYGSTTELIVKVQEYRTGIWKKEAVTILSRNNPPEMICSVCEKNPAEWVNPEGFYTGEPFLCEECLKKKKEDREMEEDEYEEEDEYMLDDGWMDEDFLLPICNSPRMGVCGYCGSEKYPEKFVPDIMIIEEKNQ